MSAEVGDITFAVYLGPLGWQVVGISPGILPILTAAAAENHTDQSWEAVQLVRAALDHCESRESLHEMLVCYAATFEIEGVEVVARIGRRGDGGVECSVCTKVEHDEHIGVTDRALGTA